MKPARAKQSLGYGTPSSIDSWGAITLTHSTYSDWLGSVVQAHLVGVGPGASQCSEDGCHRMKGLSAAGGVRTSLGLLDALAMRAVVILGLSLGT